jgi:multiple sugar transport system substrate-binding protein
MMKNKIKWISLLVCLMLVTVGCSKGTTTGQSENKSKDPMVIEYFSHPIYTPQSSDPKRAEYVKNAMEKFEKENNVKFKVTLYPSANTDESMAKLMEQMAAGKKPDIALIDGYVFPQFTKYLKPLDELMNKEGIDPNDYFDFAQDVIKGSDEKTYGLYLSSDARVLFYRKDLVPNPPQTVEELMEVGKQLKKKGYDGLLYPGGRGEGTAVTTLWPLYWAQGGNLINGDKPAFTEGADREKMLNVLNFVQETIETGVTPTRVTTYGAENDLNAEVKVGKVAMFFGSSHQISYLKGILSKEEMDKWEIAPIPGFVAGEHGSTSGGYVWAVPTEDQAKKELAMKFLATTFSNDEANIEWSNTTGLLPARESIFNSPDLISDRFTPKFREYLSKYSQVRPPVTSYPKISSQMQITVSNVISGAKTPEEALDEFNEAMNKQ